MDVATIVNIILCILSFILAVISVVTVVITLRQNNKMISVLFMTCFVTFVHKLERRMRDGGVHIRPVC